MNTEKKKFKKLLTKSFSLYEPEPEPMLRTDETILDKVDDKILEKLPKADYRILLDKKQNSQIFSIKTNTRKMIHLPVAAAGHEINLDEKFVMYAIPTGAAGTSEPPIYSFSPYIREMADPHDGVARRRFRDAALTDPTVAAGLEDRTTEFFADGYTFGLKLKSSRDDTGHVLTEEESQTKLEEHEKTYLKYVKQIEDWDKGTQIRGEHKQRSALETRIVHGRGMIRIYPPLNELELDKLPYNLKLIPAEEMGSVIIERRLGVIIALRVQSTDDETYILLPPGVVYVRQRDNALTREEQFFGRSSFEPIIQPSRAYREALNFHIPKGMASTYIPKILMEIELHGSPAEKEKTITDTLANFAKEGTDLIGIEASKDGKLQVVSVQPNHAMMESALDRYESILMSVVRTDALRLGKIKNLTRDIATILEIHHIRNVRTTDEKQISDDFIAQLYQPLLAHLARQPNSQIPVQITITRITPTDETTDIDGDGKQDDPTFKNQADLTEQKSNEMSKKKIQQPDAITPSVGAAAKSQSRGNSPI